MSDEAAPARRRLRVFKVWSSAPEDPRLRRPTDVLLLIVSLLLAIGTGLWFHAHPAPAPAPPASSSVVDLLTWVAEVVYGLLTVWALIIVLLALLGGGGAIVYFGLLFGLLKALRVPLRRA